MKIKELKEKTDKELDKLLNSHKDKLRELRFRVASKQLKNIREIRQIKKEISQILTLSKERSLGLNKTKQISEDKDVKEKVVEEKVFEDKEKEEKK